METPSEERSLEEILATMAQLEYRNHKAIEELSGQVSETNQLLARINRRLWAQNIFAWIQLIGLILIILLNLLLLIGIVGLPPALELLRQMR